MSGDAVVQRLLGFFHETLAQDVTGPEVDLIEADVLDSLAFVELVLFLEQEFGLAVPLDEFELENFRTIQMIAEFIRSRGPRLRLAANGDEMMA